MSDVNSLLEPDEQIIWVGRASERWEPAFSFGSKLFYWSIVGIFGLFAALFVGGAIAEGRVGPLAITCIGILYFRWNKLKSKVKASEKPKNYVITDQRVFFPNDYKASAQYQSIPLSNLDEIKVVTKGDFINIIFREELVRKKGSKHNRRMRLTYGFKGLEKSQSPEALLRQALGEAGTNNAFFSYDTC